MMSGCTDHRSLSTIARPRRYEVVARGLGWSISVNGLCTRPFRSKLAAERIAKTLQKQADALRGKPRRGGGHHA